MFLFWLTYMDCCRINVILRPWTNKCFALIQPYWKKNTSAVWEAQPHSILGNQLRGSLKPHHNIVQWCSKIFQRLRQEGPSWYQETPSSLSNSYTLHSDFCRRYSQTFQHFFGKNYSEWIKTFWDNVHITFIDLYIFQRFKSILKTLWIAYF